MLLHHRARSFHFGYFHYLLGCRFKGCPPAAALLPGPSKICLCCIIIASSDCTLSTSKRTGIARITNDVPAIHNVERENLYIFFTPATDKSVTFPVALLSDS